MCFPHTKRGTLRSAQAAPHSYVRADADAKIWTVWTAKVWMHLHGDPPTLPYPTLPYPLMTMGALTTVVIGWVGIASTLRIVKITDT